MKLYFVKWKFSTFQKILVKKLLQTFYMYSSTINHNQWYFYHGVSQTWKTKTLWVSQKLRLEKENNFSQHACRELLQDILFTWCLPFCKVDKPTGSSQAYHEVHCMMVFWNTNISHVAIIPWGNSGIHKLIVSTGSKDMENVPLWSCKKFHYINFTSDIFSSKTL